MRGIYALAFMAALPGTAMAQTDPHVDCTEIEAGTAKGYNCINQQLQALVRQTPRPSSAGDAPYNATSPSNVTGQFNEDATRTRLGSNFGKSVTPERPTVTYAPAFAPRP
jgi:hypothetical protein